MRRFFLLLCVLLFSLSSADAVYKAKKRSPETRPVFTSPEEERVWRLRNGEVLTEAGYLKQGVWGRMEGLVRAPPEVVWRLFFHANHWKRYGIPNLIDSRAVTAEIALAASASEKVEDFYRLVGDRYVEPSAGRRKGGKWTSYAFQYYDLPWPLANRWMIVKTLNDETRSHEGIYRAEWERMAGNVVTVNGTLLLEPFEGDENLTRMEYRVTTNPGPKVPRFLLRWATRRTMPAVIRVVRRQAASPP